jgi:hypothetical protein
MNLTKDQTLFIDTTYNLKLENIEELDLNTAYPAEKFISK